MKVYITYDIAEGKYWLNIYQITNDFEEVKRDYKKNLKDFISYGPDPDYCSYQIHVIDMPEEDYNKLESLSTDNDSNIDELDAIMTQITEKCTYSNCLLSTDVYRDIENLISYYCNSLGKDPNNIDDYIDCEMELFKDKKLYDNILSQYIDDTYSI